MNYLQYLDFETVEQGEINIKEAKKVRDKMGGDLYYGIVNEDVEELENKLRLLKLKVNNEQ